MYTLSLCEGRILVQDKVILILAKLTSCVVSLLINVDYLQMVYLKSKINNQLKNQQWILDAYRKSISYYIMVRGWMTDAA